MVTLTGKITKSVDNPRGGDKIKRECNYTYPAVISYDDQGNLSHVSDLEALLNFAGEAAKIRKVEGDNAALIVLAELVQEGIDAKVEYLVRNELGKGDEVSKQIAKAIAALKKVPGMEALPEDAIRQIILQSPDAKKAVESVTIEEKVTMDISLTRMFTDMRKKRSEDTDSDSNADSDSGDSK